MGVKRIVTQSLADTGLLGSPAVRLYMHTGIGYYIYGYYGLPDTRYILRYAYDLTTLEVVTAAL